jgi:hypothetical protein
VERGDGRDAEAADEVEHVLAVLAAPDPVLVLDRHDVGAIAQGAGRAHVVGRHFLADPVMDLGWVERWVVAGVEDGDLAAARRGREVTRERGDAAASRWVGGDEGCSNDERAPLEESLRAVVGKSARRVPGATEVDAGPADSGSPPAWLSNAS